MKKLLLSLLVAAGTVFGSAADTYKLVTSDTDVTTTDSYIIVCPGVTYKNTPYQWAMGGQDTNNRKAVSITISNDEVEITNQEVSPITFEASGNSDFPYQIKDGENYLNSSSTSKNYLTSTSTKATATTYCTVSVETTGIATITYNNKIASGKNAGKAYTLQCYYSGGSSAVPSGQLFSTYGTTQKAVYLYKKVTNGGSEGPDPAVKTKPEISFPEEAYTVIQGDPFTAPEITNPNNLTVTYTSGNSDVATVDSATGAVTLTGVLGTATITATSKETDTYYAGEASYSVTVQAKPLKDAGLSFAESVYEATIGTLFTAPELVNPNDLTVTYTSETPGVATVDATTGEVTLVGQGSAIIKVTSEANEEYQAGYASYTLNVADPNAVVKELSADFIFAGADANIATIADKSGLEANSIANQKKGEGANDLINVTLKNNDVSVKFTDNASSANDPRWWAAKAGNQLRIYANNYMTISVPTGFKITSIEIKKATTSTDEYGIGNAPADGSFNADKNVWTADAAKTVNEVKFAPTTKTFINSITVNYESTVSTGIEAAEAVEGVTEWYDLQGRKVAVPAHGIFIKRQGNKAVKVRL